MYIEYCEEMGLFYITVVVGIGNIGVTTTATIVHLFGALFTRIASESSKCIGRVFQLPDCIIYSLDCWATLYTQ